MSELGRIAFEASKAVDPNAWMTPEWDDLGAARQAQWDTGASAVAAALVATFQPQMTAAATMAFALNLIQGSVPSAMLGTDWRHKKTGNVYQVIGGCRIEATNKLGILYAREGVVWCRPSEEFLDGRFEAL